MAKAAYEESNDYRLAGLLSCSVDTVRTERAEAYQTLQRRMREKGHTVPDDLREFIEWCKRLLSSRR